MNSTVVIFAQFILLLALIWALLINSWHPFFFLFIASSIGSSSCSCACKESKENDKFAKQSKAKN